VRFSPKCPPGAFRGGSGFVSGGSSGGKREGAKRPRRRRRSQGFDGVKELLRWASGTKIKGKRRAEKVQVGLSVHLDPLDLGGRLQCPNVGLREKVSAMWWGGLQGIPVNAG
jgi:hypothetical protein